MPPPPRYITARGLTLTLREWSELTGIKAETIRSRIDHQGQTPEQALGTPVATQFDPRARQADPPPRRCPPMKPHTGSGQAVAYWMVEGERRWRYFGKWGSEEAKAAYRRFQAEWAGGSPWKGKAGVKPLTVAGLVARYMRHVRAYYVKDGKPTSEQHGQRAALRVLLELCGTMPVSEVRGQDLKACQRAMVAKGLTRTTVNQYAWRVTSCFRWGVGEDLVPPDVAAVLESVPNLQPGRTSAADPEPVMSVPPADVEATIPHLDPDPGRRAVLEGMVRLMLACGPRPGELCAMTAQAVDRTGDVWCYRVGGHKTLHRQARRKPKLVWIGPRGQAILRPFLDDPGPGGRVWCFPPKGKAGKRTAIGRGRFAEIVRRACGRAGVRPWHPHQLRHNRATEVQRIYEDDAAAGAAIGDTPHVAALVYADPSEAVARRIALATG